MNQTETKKTLINTDETHSKFWGYEITQDQGNGEFTTKISWGRIGTKGQSQEIKSYSKYEAENVALRKMYEKESRGYKLVSEEELALITTRAQIVGTNMKCEALDFVGPVEGHPDAYRIIKGEALANPDLKPKVWCVVRHKEQLFHILADEQDCFLIEFDPRRIPAEHDGMTVTKRTKFNECQDKTVKKLLERIPPIIGTLF